MKLVKSFGVAAFNFLFLACSGGWPGPYVAQVAIDSREQRLRQAAE